MHFPVVIGLYRSRLMGTVLIVVAATGFCTILSWPQSFGLRVGAAAVLALATALAWHGLRQFPGTLRLERDGTLAFRPEGATEFVRVDLLPGSIAHPWFTVLRLRLPDGQRRVLPVTVDSLKPDDFRCLRVFLRWGAGAGGR